MTRQRELELSETVRAACPLIAKAMPYMGHATIRNRGTAGGSLSHADPSAELPGVALALGAEMIAGGPNGRRTVPATEFFFAELTTALEPDEMLCEIRFPEAPAGSRAAFAEVGSHFGGLALVGVAAQIDLDSAGRCTKAALAATGAGERPTRLSSTEAVLTGEVLEKQSIAEAAEAAAGDVEPLEDLHATAHWRRRAAVAMAARVLHEIADEAGNAMTARREGPRYGQWPRVRAQRGTPNAAGRFSAPRMRPNGDARGLCARGLRCVHHRVGRRSRSEAASPSPFRPRERRSRPSKAWRTGRVADRLAAGLPREPRAPMRLLHARFPHVADGISPGNTEPG